MPLSNNGKKLVKEIGNPDHITILLPTRERIKPLDRMFDSLSEMTVKKELVDVRVYVDHDDLITGEYIRKGAWKRFGIDITWYRGGRTLSQGEMNNTLWKKCNSKAGIYMTGTDDYLFVTPGWDRQVRRGIDRFPDRIAIVYPEDPTALPGMVTFPIMSAEWANAFGRVLTDYFPFWFDDTWIDQVGQMIDRKVALDVRMEPQGGKGKTPRMRNLLFWRKFFDFCTLEDRIREADILRRKIYPPGSEAYRRSLERGLRLAGEFARATQKRSAKEIAFMEEQYSVRPETWGAEKLSGYLLFESRIVTMLLERLHHLIRDRHHTKAQQILDTLSCSSLRVKDLEGLREKCLQGAESRDKVLETA